MEQQEIVLCASSAYDKKFYLNQNNPLTTEEITNDNGEKEILCRCF